MGGVRQRPRRREVWLAAALVVAAAGAIYAGQQDCTAARAAMVAELRRPGARPAIRDERVLAAMGKVPRHQFVPAAYLSRAYRDTEIPLGSGEVMCSPYVVALMTQTLELKRKARVLEVGTGSGYQTAVLAELGAVVFSVEQQKSVADKAAACLYACGYRSVKLRVGEEAKGWPANGPYDAILVTAAVDRAPNGLVSQLAEGGCLVYALGRGPEQTLNRIRKQGDVIRAEAVTPIRMSDSTRRPRRGR